MLFTESDHVHESEVCNTEITEKFGKQLNNLDKEEAAMVQRVQAGGWRWEGGAPHAKQPRLTICMFTA